MKIIIVDENDEPVGVMEREEARKSGYFWRAAALWIGDGKGKILAARRSLQKLHGPGQWSCSAVGTLEEGETYDSNVIKEAFEEIGLADIEPVKGPKIFIKHSDGSGVFAQVYLLKLDRSASDFILQKEEVDQVKWFSREELEECLRGGSPDFEYVRDRWPAWSKMLEEVGFIAKKKDVL